MEADALLTELGERLRRLRVDQRITQRDLADRANVSLGAVAHLEQGAPATTVTLAKVLHVLGREDWVEALNPPPVTFSPLRVLAQRESERAGRRPAPRVRRRSGGEAPRTSRPGEDGR